MSRDTRRAKRKRVTQEQITFRLLQGLTSEGGSSCAMEGRHVVHGGQKTYRIAGWNAERFIPYLATHAYIEPHLEDAREHGYTEAPKPTIDHKQRPIQ